MNVVRGRMKALHAVKISGFLRSPWNVPAVLFPSSGLSLPVLLCQRLTRQERRIVTCNSFSRPRDKSMLLSMLNELMLTRREPSAISQNALLKRPRFRTIASMTISALDIREEEEVVLAMGGNIGDRVSNFNKGLQLMRQAGIKVLSHSCLYETAPAYVTDQPFFLNSAVKARTTLSPHGLLHVLKGIEKELGRDFQGLRFGPRPLDLDIIFYGNLSLETEDLQIPHPRMLVRPFVLAPVVDLLGSDGDRANHWSTHAITNGGIRRHYEAMGGESLVGSSDLRRVTPVGRQLLTWGSVTRIMGILNVTPDSFSDGGKFDNVKSALEHAKAMVDDNVDIIDIGGQSTRPGATRLHTNMELSRVIPVIEALANDPHFQNTIISVDTFDSQVAAQGVAAGAQMINDISGGSIDSSILPVVASLGVPYVMMHIRGDPATMQEKQYTTYGDVCQDAGAELMGRVQLAEAAGIPSWRILLDPGLGFSKTSSQSFELLRRLQSFKEAAAAASSALRYAPLLVGASRKGFLGKVTDRKDAKDRDFATCAATAAAVAGSADIVRVHNVRAARDAVRVADAIWRTS